jgi:hypothetical protein
MASKMGNINFILNHKDFIKIADDVENGKIKTNEIVDEFVKFAKSNKISAQNCKDFILHVSDNMEDEKKVYTILSKASTCEKIIKGVEMHWNMSGKTELAKITKNPTIVREVLPTAPAGNVYKYGGKFHIIVINSGAVDDIGSLPLLFDTGSPIEGIEKDYFVGDKGKPNLMPQNTIRAVVPLATEKRPVMSFFQERERNKEDFEQYRKLKKERGETVSNRNG